MVNNIKFYDKYIRMYKEGTLHKYKFIRKRLASLLLCTTMISSVGCNIKPKENNYNLENEIYNNSSAIYDNQNNSHLNTNSNSESTTTYENELSKEDIFIKSERLLKFSKIQVEDILSKISDLKLDYKYGELFNTEEAYAKYKAMKYYDASSDVKDMPFYINGRIDSNELYKLVLINNEEYRNNEEFFNKYDEFDNEFIKHVCDIFAETINKEIELGNLTTTLDDTLLNLKDMKVFKAYQLTNGFVTDDNCVCFSSVGLDAMEGITGYDYSTDMIISHEAYHFTQKLSTETREEQGIERGYGYSVEFEDLEVNPLYHNWLIEAAAEQLACYKYNSEPMTYEYKIGYMHTLSFVLLLDEDFDVKDIERLTQQQSLETVFETFNVTTEEEKIELLNLLYAINILQEEPEDFMNAYMREILGKDTITDDELVDMKVTLKNSICLTLSKYFYKNLTNKIYSEGMSTVEIYRLISIFEMDLMKHFSYATDGNFDARQQFIYKYCELQDIFFKEMGISLSEEASDIENEYQAYNNSIEIKVDTLFEPAVYEDYEFNCLDESKNQFANFMFKYLINYKTMSVDEVLAENNVVVK